MVEGKRHKTGPLSHQVKLISTSSVLRKHADQIRARVAKGTNGGHDNVPTIAMEY